MRKIYILLIAAVFIAATPVVAQKKKAPVKKQPAAATAKKSSPATKNQGATASPGQGGNKAARIPESKVDTFKLQVIPMVKFFESTLNFLADKRNAVNEKQTIITQSYLKFTWNDEVQVEDDLDDNRLVPLYKDMPNYLTDVDFFFQGARFVYSVQDVSLMANQEGLTYFKVTANRSLKGVDLQGDSVNSNKVRYIEMNYDSVKQQLKIVSVYTTKLNEKDDLRRWWNDLSQGWKGILAKGMTLGDNLPMGRVDLFNDTAATVGNETLTIDAGLFYRNLNQIIRLTEIDLSGNVTISNLDPLIKMTELKTVSIAGTPVSDLMPLRNLNKLESLDISNTLVSTLEPLRYCIHLRILKMKGTSVTDLSFASDFPALETLDFSNTRIGNISSLSELARLRDLKLRNTSVTDLTPVAGLLSLELLNFSVTKVTSLSPLSKLTGLRILQFDSTSVSDLTPLDGLTDLQKVYCDYSGIDAADAAVFRQKHPESFLIYQTPVLMKWWNGLSQEWQKILDYYVDIPYPPTTEQLHRLALIDSININGRTTIRSLEPLSKLVLLRNLQCQSTGISDLAPLNDLIRLKQINIANTQVALLNPLTGMKGLEILQMDNTLVADLSPLDGLDSLRMIYADNTKINQKEANRFIQKNPECLVIFSTYDNSKWWEKVSQSWKAELIRQVGITGNPDKIQLQQITNLTTIGIADNPQISDLTPITHFPFLKELKFTGTSVSRLDSVAKIRNLEKLNCANNPVSDLTPLASLTKLKELSFSNTQVEDLLALKNMNTLEVLKFSGTQVKNLKYLQNLTNLRVLEFYNTRISSVDVLEGMKRLESVKMFNTKVSSKKYEKLKKVLPAGCEIVYY